MASSRGLELLLLLTLVAGPSFCHGNVIQDAIGDVIGWARHELAAWAYPAVPDSEGQLSCLCCDVSYDTNRRV